MRAQHAVLALFTLSGALFGVWASRVPAIQKTFDLSPRDLGFLLLLIGVGAILCFPISGSSCYRYGAARVAQLLALACCLVMLLVAANGNLVLFALALMLFGAVMGALDVAMNSWGAEVEQAAGRPIMSSFHAFFSLGAGLGAASGALAAWAGIGYQLHFSIFAIPAFGLAWAGQHEWRRTAPADTGIRAFQFTLPKGRLLIVAAVAFAAAMSEGGMADWSALFLTNVLKTSESEGAIALRSFPPRWW